MVWLWRWFFSAGALMFVAWVFDGIRFDSLWSIFLTAFVLGVINMFIRPVVQLLALPVTLFSLGIFALVVNALMVLLASSVVSGFHVSGFWTAFWGSIVLSLVSFVMNSFLKEERE
ncbi:MAG TPA: phage holin family protein [Bacilli bacterium]|nr:phage holin family protein [Bacilli bacterium]